MRKTAQLNFYTTPEIRQELKRIAFEENTTQQAIFEKALDLFFEDRGESAPGGMASLPKKDQKLAMTFLDAVKYGDEELVTAMLQTMRGILRIAERRRARESKKVRSDARKAG